MQVEIVVRKTIRGLERGLRVIAALRSESTCSLRDLHEATGIAKPTLLRILATLEVNGVAYRRLADGRYRFSEFGGRSYRRDRYSRVVEAAGPLMDRLSRKVLWPSDLMVPAGDHMERRETSQSVSPFFPTRTQRNRVGQPVNWLLTGVGRAYLAFCPAAERERVLAKLRNSILPEDALARQPQELARILAETRKRGYGTRDRSFTGGAYGGPPRDDGLAGLAVPLAGKRRVFGAINLLWIKNAFSVEQFADRHLGDLLQTAQEIVEVLERPRGDRALSRLSS